MAENEKQKRKKGGATEVLEGEVIEAGEGEGANLALRPKTENSLILMPVMNLQVARERLAEFQEFVKFYLMEGIDYGTIPGTPKPTLYKPGADKLCELYGLSDQYRIITQVEDFNRTPELFDYTMECALWRGDRLISTGMGSCNSYESKYKLRDQQRECPKCGKTAIIRGNEKWGGGWVCWKKRDGCGAKFEDGDQTIEGQKSGKINNDDICTLKNTILKMAKKRAKVDATLGATRSSGIFTQDIEDMGLAVDDTNGTGSKKAATAVAEEKVAAAGKEVTFAHSPDGKTLYVGGGAWPLIANVLRPAGVYSEAWKVWAIPTKDEKEIVQACQERKLDIKQVEFKQQAQAAKESPKATSQTSSQRGAPSGSKKKGPMAAPPASIQPIMTSETVDPAKSKCSECGCSFGVHLKTCSKFVDPHLAHKAATPQKRLPEEEMAEDIVSGPLETFYVKGKLDPATGAHSELVTSKGSPYRKLMVNGRLFFLFDNMRREIRPKGKPVPMFDLLESIELNTFLKFIVKPRKSTNGQTMLSIKNFLQVGNVEWEPDGLLVIRRDAPPAPMDEREPSFDPNNPDVTDDDVPDFLRQSDAAE